MAARAEDTLTRLQDEPGAACHVIPGDATDLAAQQDAIAATAERFDGVHAAFANAGTGLDTPGTENGDPEEWRKVIDLNIMALLYTARASLPELTVMPTG